MSQATLLYEFLYDWANKVLNTDAGLSMNIIQSHQDVPAPSESGTYLVIDYTPNRTKIGSFSAGDVGNLITAHKYAPTFATTDVDIATDTITIASHSFVDNGCVSFSSTGVLPAGLAADTYYIITGSTTDTFQVTATYGGGAVDITDVGTGTHTITREGTRSLIDDYSFVVEVWEVNGTGETLRLLIDSMGRQDIRDLWKARNYSFMSSGTIQNLPRLPQNEWKKEAMVEITIGSAEATMETPGFIGDLEYTGTIPKQGASGNHTVTNT